MSGRRAAWTVAVVIVAVNLVALALSALDRSAAVPGPAGSAYVTTALGTAALAETLEALGTEVILLRERVGDEALTDARTFLVVEPGFSGYADGEVAALRRFVERGGRLVFAGSPDRSLLDDLVPGAPRWGAAGSGLQRVWAPPAWGAPAEALEGAGIGSWVGEARGVAMAGWEEGVTVLAVPIGDGVVVLVADAGMLTNERLDRGDNAVWSVALLEAGPVVFDEFRHGFGRVDGGAGLLPPSWSRAMPLIGLAVLVTLVTYGRRSIPVRPAAPETPPERLQFVEGLAGALRRTGRPGPAVEPTRQAAIRLLVELVGSVDGPDELRRAAIGAGLSPSQAAALATGADTASEAMEIDRALAALRSGR